MPIYEFLDDQHESFMAQEQQPTRKGAIDLRVHACLYFIRPSGHRYVTSLLHAIFNIDNITLSLKALDIEVMKHLGSRVNLIPVIAKADTLTPKDLAQYKLNVSKDRWMNVKVAHLDSFQILDSIARNHIQVYSCPIDSEDEEITETNKSIMASLPFAIIGSTQDVTTADGRTVKGREYSWGVAEVENEDHCDFKKLRKLLVRSHMHDLISTTEENHYENYRQTQMGTRKFGEPKFQKYENPKFKDDEDELRLNFTKQVKDEENRFRQWEAQVCCICISIPTTNKK